MLRSFHQLQRVNPGFTHERVLVFRVGLPRRKYPGSQQTIGFYRNLLDRLQSLPGVQTASVTSRVPLEGGGWDTSFLIEGQPEPPPHERPSTELQTVGPDYFRTVGIPLVRGRSFTEQDNLEHLRGTGRENSWGAGLNTIIVNEEFARRHWPGEDALGKRVRMDWPDNPPVMTVIGVVGNVKWRHLAEPRGNVQAYLPFLQLPFQSMTVAVKTTLPPETLVSAVRRQVLALDPEQPIYDIRTLSGMREERLAPQRLNFTLLGLFAIVALALAVIGLYGVLAYAVVQRQREIGVRMALGAQRRDVLGLVLIKGMKLTGIGIGIGVTGALGLTRVLSSLLFEIKPIDPLTFMTIPLLLVSVAVLACWLPARKAARIDPMEALRYE